MNKLQTPVFRKMGSLLTSDYLAQFELIKPEEYSRAGLITINDDSLTPKISPGSMLLVVWIEFGQYDTVDGLVAVTNSDRLGKVMYGRVKSISETELHISQKQADGELVTVIGRNLITSISSIRYIVNGPAL